MTNLLFFILGFITFILVRYTYNSLIVWIAFRKRRNMWVKPNFDTRLIYNKRTVK